MAVDRPFSITDAMLGEGLSMLVVERPNRTSFSVTELKIAADAQGELESAWNNTLDALRDDGQLLDYSPDLNFRGDDPRIPVMNTNLAEENEIIAALLEDVAFELVAPNEIETDHLYLYALVSDTEAGRVVMIKKQTPAKAAREGKWWALAGKELRVIDEDPWQIHPRFDLVVSIDGAYVLSLVRLDQLLGDSQILTQRVGDWVARVAAALPIGDGQDAILIERCQESSRLRSRLRAIHSRGHLAKVTIDDVKIHAQRMKLDPTDFVENDSLLITETNVDQLLKLLNEDLFTGGLTGDPFVSGGKEPMAAG